MIKLRILALMILAALTTMISCSEEPLNKENMLSTLDSVEHKLSWLDHKIELEKWRELKFALVDSLEFYEGLYAEVVSDPVAMRYLQHGAMLLDDEVDRRRRDIMFGAFLTGQIEFESEIADLRESLSRKAARLRANFDGSERTIQSLEEAVRTDSDRVRRESAYRALATAGDEYADDLEKLFRLRNQKTQRLGYNNFLALQFKAADLSLDEHAKLLRHLDSLTEAPYRALLDEMRNNLNLPDLEIWDIGFAFADIRRQLDRYFPVDSQLAFIGRSFEDIGFDLDKLPIYFDEEIASGESPARAFLVKPPHDQRLLGGINSGFAATKDLVCEIGRAVHFSHTTQDEPLFISRIDDVCVRGVACVFAGMIHNPKWLTDYAGVPTRLAQDFTTNRKKEALIELRSLLLMSEFEKQAYANPNRDLNKLFWDLLEQYLMLPRHEDLKPWTIEKDYIDHPGAVQNIIYGRMFAAQTLAFLRDNYGGVVGNPMTSSFLNQNYFRFGGRYDWRELVKRGTDEELNPRFFALRLGL